MVFVLAAILVAITVFVYMLGKQGIISPSILFMLPFSISAFWLTLNISRWNVVLYGNTLMIITFGCLSFLLGVFVASLYKARGFKVKRVLKVTEYSSDVCIPNKLFVALAIIELVIFIICLREIRAVVHRYGYRGTLSFEIYRYRNLGMYTTNSTSLGRWVDWAYQFNLGCGYIWAYILIHRLSLKRKINVSIIACLVISIITALIKGGRQSTIQIIFAAMTYYVVFYGINHKRRKIPWKSLFKILLIIVILGISFQSIGTILGRTVQADFMQYIAVYLSGGIHNLNVWLNNSLSRSSFFGQYTFANIYPYLGRKFGRTEWIFVLSSPYLSANGHNSGNIYTTFWPFIYDFGYIGAIIMPFIMGLISERIYKYAICGEMKSEANIKLSIILYGYTSYLLEFSFFGDKFYGGFVKLAFFRTLVIWITMIYVLNRMTSVMRSHKHNRQSTNALRDVQ